MKLTNVEKKEKSTVELSITVEKEEFAVALDKAYKQNVGSITVPGFRKGKAPRKMIEKLYGAEVFYGDAMEIAFPDAYEKAVAEAGIEPVGQPNLTDFVTEDGEFRFKAVVPVKPELSLKAYKGLSAEKRTFEVTDADVEAELERLAERNSRIEDVERPVENGDTIDFDFDGYVDGVAFDGGKAEHYSLKIGSGSFIPGFEEQLVGKSAGEEVDVNVTFPEEYHEPSLQGKPAVFKCKIHKVQVNRVPLLDDEFAKDVSEFDTLDELKADVKAKLVEMNENQVKNEYTEKLMDELAANLEGEIPQAMYESQLDRLVEDMDYRMQMQGINLDSYLKMNQMELSAFRAMFQPQAERQVNVRLALETVAKLEGIEVTDEDVEKEFASLASQNNMDVERVKALIPAQALKEDLAVQKASDFVVSNAKAKKPAAKKAAAKKTTKKVEAEGEEKAEKKPAAKKTTKKAAEGEEKKPAAKKTTKKAEKAE